MKIIKYKLMSKDRYKVTFDTGSDIILYEDIILKYNLLTKNNINLELLEEIMNENIYYEAYDRCLTYIETKLRTTTEISSYLENKGYDNSVIKSVIEKLTDNGFLNEKVYIEAYVNDKINLSNIGPYKIKRELLSLKLDENLIDEYLSKIPDNVWKDKIEKIIDKKLKLNKNKSSNNIKSKLKVDLFNLGYDNNLIDNSIENIKINDTKAIKDEYTKAYNKYSKKYNDYELTYQIKSYLYRKGFDKNDIENIMYELKK